MTGAMGTLAAGDNSGAIRPSAARTDRQHGGCDTVMFKDNAPSA
jgi:hypothetical protein